MCGTPRRPGSVALDGIRAPTLEALIAALGRFSSESRAWLVSDLSLGAWRGHQAAREFLAQLGHAQPTDNTVGGPGAAAGAEAFGRLSHADLVGAGVDAEARGERAVLEARELADRLAGGLVDGPPRLLLVLVPRRGSAWEAENEWLCRFLVQAVAGTGSRLVVVATDADPVIPSDWTVRWSNPWGAAPARGAHGLLGLVPGAVDVDLRAAVQKADGSDGPLVLELGHGHALVAPEARRDPSAVPRLEYDRLAVVLGAFPWLRSYAEYRGNNLYVDSWRLCAEAWRRLAEGGAGIALRLLERATSCARDITQRGACMAQLQGMRIALHRFEEVAGAPDPSPALDATLRGFLLEAKGWGLVMSEQPRQADAYLEEARRVSDTAGQEREYLYLLNITALARLKAGDLAGSLGLETEIEARAARAPNPDWRLQHVNALNLARLYRRLGQPDRAATYYARAFETSRGVRSESEALHANVTMAQLEAERHRPAAALAAWLRASLHWLANRTPEAVSRRVRRAILGPAAGRPDEAPEAIAAALCLHMRQAAEATGMSMLERTEVAEKPPTIVRIEGLEGASTAPDWSCAVGAPGWGLIVIPTRVPSAWEGPEQERLGGLVRSILAATCATAELGAPATLGLDDRCGQEVPTTALELLGVAVRRGVPRMAFGEETMVVDAAVREALARESRVRLGPAVAGFDGGPSATTVSFKRHREPVVVAGTEAAVLVGATEGPSVSTLWERLGGPESVPCFLSRLRAMEEARLVELELTEDACIAAGIRLPSSAS